MNEAPTLERFLLVEVEPGFYLAENGETLDLSDSIPTRRRTIPLSRRARRATCESPTGRAWARGRLWRWRK
jgi:hypothetical protein